MDTQTEPEKIPPHEITSPEIPPAFKQMPCPTAEKDDRYDGRFEEYRISVTLFT